MREIATKSSLKQLFRDLIPVFLKSENVQELKDIKRKLTGEVLTCPYNESTTQIVELGVKMWGLDLDRYIEAIEHKTVTPDLKQFTNLSLAGLANFIDLSQLPD